MKCRILTLMVFFVGGMLAADGKFEVREIATPDIDAIAASEQELTKAIAALAAAQTTVEMAKARRDSAVAKAMHGFPPIEGKCVAPGQTTSSFYQLSRTYRRVELRGKYALITEGSEPCSSWVTSNGVLTLRDSTLNSYPIPAN